MYPSQQSHSPRQQHPRTPNNRPTTKRRWMPWLIVGGIGAAGAAVFTFIGALLLIGLLGNRGVASGVSIAGLSVGGQSVEAARSQLQQWAARPVTLTDGSRSWQVSLAELGVTVDVDGTIVALKNG